MIRFSTSSLRVRLLLLILFAVLPVFGLTLYTAAEERQLAADRAKDKALWLVRLVSSDQERLIEGGYQFLNVVAQLPQLHNIDHTACSELFTGLLKQYPFYTSLGVFQTDGDLLCSAPPASGPVNIADRHSFQRALQTRDFAIGDYQLGRITGKATLLFNYPVLNEADQVQAVLFAALDLAWLNQRVAEAELPPGATLTVRDRNGTILARYPNAGRWVGQTIQEAPIFQAISNHKGEGTSESTGVDGIPRLYAFRPLYNAEGDVNVYVSVGIPTEVAFAGVNKILARNLAGLGLVIALVFVIAWGGSNLFLLRPVNDLLRATKRLAAGNLGARTGLPYGAGEIGQLARAFDEMAGALEQRDTQVRRAEAKYRALVEQIPAVMYIATLGEVYHMVFISPQVERLLGFSPEEFITEPGLLVKQFHTDDRERVMTDFARSLASGEPFRSEYRMLTRDGQVIWVHDEARILCDEAGQPQYLQGVLLDISERKRAEEALKIERQSLFSLLDGLPAFVYLQARDYSIRFSNRHFWEHFGKPKKRPCYEVLQGCEKPCEECPTFLVFDTNRSITWERTLFNGRIYQMYAHPFSDMDGSQLVLVLGIDVTERKRAVEALLESEERYRILFNMGNDAVSVYELVDQATPGKFVEVNDNACKRLGYPREELLGQSPLNINEEPNIITAVVEKLLTEKHVLFESVHVAKDGRKIPVENNARLFELRGRTTVLTISRDITERKQAEEKLRAAHRRLLDIIEFLPDATFVIDSDKKVIAWNRAIEEMTGVRKEEIIGKGNYAYSVPFYGKPRPMVIDRVFTGDPEPDAGYENVERKGNTLLAEAFVPCLYDGKGAYIRASAAPLFDANGNIIGAVQSIRDTTQRKQEAEELRLSRERFSKAFNASPGMMYIITPADGRYVDVNDSFLSITGYRREEIVGCTTTELSILADPAERLRVIKMVREQGEIRNLEVNFRTKSGEARIGMASVEKIELNGEQLLLVLMNDITERKQLEKEMTRFDRLSLVGEMAAGIGHEIRNPMTTVRGFLQILGDKKECNQYKEYFTLMIEELDRANSIISEFLSMAKNKRVDLKSQNLNHIVQALSPLIQADATVSDKHVNVELKDIPDLLLDEKEIRQLILNLVRNGLEAMSPGKELTVKTFKDSEGVVLAVRDQGTGIEPDLLEKIGTPFFTTKDNGTGLGLAVCYSIAKRHNATIHVETGSEGTTFFVRFKATKLRGGCGKSALL